MTRIVICGGPRTGKTTHADAMWNDVAIASGARDPKRRGLGERDIVRHTDDLIEQVRHLGKDGWSEASRIASSWLDEPSPWIIEGVAMSRALRKWRDAHPGEPPPVDRVIRMTVPVAECTAGQLAMAKGEAKVWAEIEDWLSGLWDDSVPHGDVYMEGRLVHHSAEHQVRSSTDG